MPARPLPLNALRAFEAVARHQHLGHAATELCVTPSAISHLIKKLESELEINLLSKSGRRIVLTENGKQLAPALTEHLTGITQAVRGLHRSSGKQTLTVSLRSYFSAKWLAPRLKDFWSRHPHIELRLLHSNFVSGSDWADIDVAIVWSHEDQIDPGASKLIGGDLIPIFSPTMPGASKITKPEQLLECTLLQETDYNSWEAWFQLELGQVPRIKNAQAIDDSNVRYQAAVDGLGVELCCRELLQDDIASGRLLAPFDTALQSYGYYLVFPDKSAKRHSTEQFTAWLLEQVNEVSRLAI